MHMHKPYTKKYYFDWAWRLFLFVSFFLCGGNRTHITSLFFLSIFDFATITMYKLQRCTNIVFILFVYFLPASADNGISFVWFYPQYFSPQCDKSQYSPISPLVTLRIVLPLAVACYLLACLVTIKSLVEGPANLFKSLLKHFENLPA